MNGNSPDAADPPAPAADLDAAANAARSAARAQGRRDLFRAQREEDGAAQFGAGRYGNTVAAALADAFLTCADWRRSSLVAVARQVLGRAPRWMGGVVDDIIEAYPRPPTDRPREFAGYIARLASFRANIPGAPGTSRELRPAPVRVRSRPVRPTRSVRRPFHTAEVDDVGALAALLGFTTDELDWYADRRGMNRTAPDRRLRHYSYQWLNGRLIEAPKPRMRAIQRRLLAQVIGRIPTHPAVHGFVVGRSPHTFAAPHAGRSTVIRLDVTSFFASVTAPRVYGLLRTAGYPEPVAHAMTGLVTTRTPASVIGGADRDIPDRAYRLALLRNAHLPQGAPTSPALANLCGFRLDRRLEGLAGSFRLRYTRYADDLAFSGDLSGEAARAFVARVNEIALDEGFRINGRKTRIRGQGDRQALAGLVVNSAPAIPREEYDALRALLHNAARTGLDEQNREGRIDFRGHLAGRIAWVGHRHPARAAKLAVLFEAACAR
jgi:hypothetical protein